MKPGRQALAIVLLAFALAAAYSLWCDFSGQGPEFAEDPYNANLLRLENFQFKDSLNVVLVGSSLTGRLVPRYFAPADTGSVANLGLDASGPLFGLKVVAGHTPAPRLVLIEANLLAKPPDANESELTIAMDSLEFRLARYCPLFRTANRVSTRLYAWLKAGQDAALERRIEVRPKESASFPTPAPVVTSSPGEVAPTASAVKSLLRARLQSLRDRRARIMFFRMPPGRYSKAGSATDLAGELAAEFHAPILDLYQALNARGVVLVYTDGVHLAAPSARRAAAVLAELWKEAEKQP